jgi:ribonuclease H / adenosylcobalamin/alpha-ribazole phosphatase
VSFIVEADGGSRGNPGPAAFGALVRDASSMDVLGEVAEAIGVATNNVAEYRGLIAGLRLARELDPAAAVEVRMDSKLVIEQMAGRWKIKHPDLRPLASEASALLPSSVTWTWVPRAENAAADALLNQVLDGGEPVFGLFPPPSVQASEPAADPVNRLVGWGDVTGPPTRVILLRHGETVHTIEKRFSGTGGTDPGLTSLGFAQAESAAAALAAGPPIDAIVHSPLRRARETAEVAGKVLGLDVVPAPGFAEVAFGGWDGYTFAEVRSREPDALAAWLASPTVPPPGGESLEAADARVRVALAELLAAYPGQTVLVVAHVTPIKLLIKHALQAPLSVVFRMELAPASISEIHWYADGLASLRSFSVATHLPAVTDG